MGLALEEGGNSRDAFLADLTWLAGAVKVAVMATLQPPFEVFVTDFMFNAAHFVAFKVRRVPERR